MGMEFSMVKIYLLALLSQLATSAPAAVNSTAPNQEQEKKTETVALISTSMGSGKAYCDLTAENHQQYAQKNGYAYFRYNEREISPGEGDPKWAKLTAISKHQGTGHEYVLWVDCDIVFTNMDKNLDSIISQYGAADLVIARDAWWRKADAGEGAGPPNVVNSGLMLFKDNEWSKNFVDQVQKEGKVPGTQLEDQPRVITILQASGQLNIPATEETEVHEHNAVVSQRVMNAFLRDGEAYNAEDPPESRWRPGDLCAHVTGMPNELRVKIINGLLRDSGRSPIPAAMRTVLESSIPALATVIDQAAKHTNKANEQEQAALVPEVNSMLTDTAIEKFEDNLRTDIVKALLRPEGADLQQIKELTLTEWFVGEQDSWPSQDGANKQH